jgi:uncharacterized protein
LKRELRFDCGQVILNRGAIVCSQKLAKNWPELVKQEMGSVPMTPVTAGMTQIDNQSAVVAFLKLPSSYAEGIDAVTCYETHGALVFVAGQYAYKIKRAVKFAYMDFSTLELRRQTIEREFELNHPDAADLYLGVVPITRDEAGSLHIDGNGVPIEWALRMRRFEQSDLLRSIADKGPLPDLQIRQLAAAVCQSHRRARRRLDNEADLRASQVIDAISRSLQGLNLNIPSLQSQTFRAVAMQQLRRSSACLRARGNAGFVRRCHGDLHLSNVVLRNGAFVLFDALEFDEELATTDTLYDLAFLLMDLEHHHQRVAACDLLNRYLWFSTDRLDIEGLIAMPLFLGLRAAVRGLVSAQRASQTVGKEHLAHRQDAELHSAASLKYLSPATARLIAVGGFSGTGKSTLAAALAPLLEPSPGAFYIRTDIERKALFGVAETERLPAASYTQAASDAVYRIVLDKARIALAAGRSVVVDGVFSKGDERHAVEAIAQEQRVPFSGLWLTASPGKLIARVSARTADASDATAEVVHRQIQQSTELVNWHVIDAGDEPERSLERSKTALGCGITSTA